MDFQEVRRMALALPGVTEGTASSPCSFHARRRLFARLRPDGESLMVKCNLFERKYLLEDFPDVFHLADGFPDYPYVLVRLAAVDPGMLRERLEAAWRMVAPRTLIARLDAGRASPEP